MVPKCYNLINDQVADTSWGDRYNSRWLPDLVPVMLNEKRFCLGLSQIYSKVCPKCFQEFPKHFTYYASQCSYYACIMLLSCQQFLALSWRIYSTDCSIRVFHFSLKVTALLKSIDLWSYVQCICAV